MNSNIDNVSIDNHVLMTESDKDNELLKNQQSEGFSSLIEPMEEVIAVRTEANIQEPAPKSFWQKYKVVIILLIVVVLIGIGIGIYFYMESKSEASPEVESSPKVESGDVKPAAAMVPALAESKPTSGTESSPAVTEMLKSPSPGAEAATPSPTSAKADVPAGELSATSAAPKAPAPEIPEAPAGAETTQAGGWYRSINSSSSPSLTSDMPFLSLFKF